MVAHLRFITAAACAADAYSPESTASFLAPERLSGERLLRSLESPRRAQYERRWK